MRRSSTVSIVGLLLGVACSGSDGPTAIEIPIAEVRILSGVCAILEGGSCIMVAEAKTSDGVVVSNPVLRWSSSNSGVASVEGDGNSAVVRGIAIGSANVIVSNTTGNVTDSQGVSVLPCSKC